jgi:hypothetical protein
MIVLIQKKIYKLFYIFCSFFYLLINSKVKRFIRSVGEAPAETKQKLEEKLSTFVESVTVNIDKVIKSRAVFILVALVEHTSYAS